VWSHGKEVSRKGFKMGARQALWELRQLLYFLKGRQKSFYLPSNMKEFTVVADLISGTSDMVIEEIGYTIQVQSRAPYNRIRITLTNGSTIDRTIISSALVGSLREDLLLNTSWSSTITVAEIAKVELVVLSRLRSDTVTITHNDANGNASCMTPVVGVFDEL